MFGDEVSDLAGFGKPARSFNALPLPAITPHRRTSYEKLAAHPTTAADASGVGCMDGQRC